MTEAPLLLIDLATDEGIVGHSYLFGYHAFTMGPLHELVLTRLQWNEDAVKRYRVG